LEHVSGLVFDLGRFGARSGHPIAIGSALRFATLRSE
jgi:hypothetical protein